MRRLSKSASASLALAVLAACSSSEDLDLDLGPDAAAGSGSDAGASGGDASPVDAAPPPAIDHFRFVLDPETPRAGHPFTLEITAYASEDDSEPLLDYEGPASVTASDGLLAGQVSAQPFEDGVATLELSLSFNGELPETVELSIRDDQFPQIAGTTEPFAMLPEGDIAELREVVINEVKWFAAGSVESNDFWLELRNTTEDDLRVTGWRIDNAGTSDAAIDLTSGLTIPAGGYLLVANRLGDDVDGERTSLTGVENVFVPSRAVALRVGGEHLVLRDREGTLIDQTPIPPGEEQDGGWPAGNRGIDFLMTMERRDELTGGGYGDGSDASEWYTWNEADGKNTTNPDARVRGTPGADNTDPSLAAPALLPYETSFEDGEPQFRLTSPSQTAAQVNEPPPGIEARTGERILSADRALRSFGGRSLQSAACLALHNESDEVVVRGFARASEANSEGDEQSDLRLRFVIEWFSDEQCLVPHEVIDRTAGANGTFNVSLSETAYEMVEHVVTPPADSTAPAASHIRVRVEVRREDDGVAEFWALDDLFVDQPEPENGL